MDINTSFSLILPYLRHHDICSMTLTNSTFNRRYMNSLAKYKVQVLCEVDHILDNFEWILVGRVSDRPLLGKSIRVDLYRILSQVIDITKVQPMALWNAIKQHLSSLYGNDMWYLRYKNYRRPGKLV